jgi:hypothetical protein
MKLFSLLILLSSSLLGQNSYFANTGLRYDYYDKVMTETTNFGFRVAGPTGESVPNGLWLVTSIDATPRSQSGSAGLRVSGAYFLKSNGIITFYGHGGVGAQTNSIVTTVGTNVTLNVANLLGNFGGGIGTVINLCKGFNSKSKTNCTVTIDYNLIGVTSQSVKPVVGLYFGTSF